MLRSKWDELVTKLACKQLSDTEYQTRKAVTKMLIHSRKTDLQTLQVRVEQLAKIADELKFGRVSAKSGYKLALAEVLGMLYDMTGTTANPYEVVEGKEVD